MSESMVFQLINMSQIGITDQINWIQKIIFLSIELKFFSSERHRPIQGSRIFKLHATHKITN